MPPNTFRIIVAGGGPVGLTAAHALHKAGIDFVLLERRPEIVVNAGSNLVLSPTGMRTLSSLGINKALEAVSSPLGTMNRLDHDGRNLGDMHFFTQMEKNHGIAPRVISRHDLTKVLYETLPPDAQDKILGNKQLDKIVKTAEGVTVMCADGSEYNATTLVGADGAHSQVRKLMRSLALDNNIPESEVNPESPYLTTYRCLWIRFPRFPGLKVGSVCETHGPNAATQLFVGEDSGVTGVYEKLEAPTQERLRYTRADQDAIIDRWGHIPMAAGSDITLRDVYTRRLEAGLVSLEEGVTDHWSWDGRIVLAGDAAHKFTPSTGAGCNNGMIDVITLTNELHSMLQSGSPSHARLAEAFKYYQSSRHAAVVGECERSGQATQMATWQNGIMKFIDRNVMSLPFLQRYLIDKAAPKIAQTPTLDFVGCSLESTGRVPWVASAPRVHV